jgi:hypothetical protein
MTSQQMHILTLLAVQPRSPEELSEQTGGTVPEVMDDILYLHLRSYPLSADGNLYYIEERDLKEVAKRARMEVEAA